jgi:hypothetical protein
MIPPNEEAQPPARLADCNKRQPSGKRLSGSCFFVVVFLCFFGGGLFFSRFIALCVDLLRFFWGSSGVLFRPSPCWLLVIAKCQILLPIGDWALLISEVITQLPYSLQFTAHSCTLHARQTAGAGAAAARRAKTARSGYSNYQLTTGYRLPACCCFCFKIQKKREKELGAGRWATEGMPI